MVLPALVLLILTLARGGESQEELPSKKTKEAVDKFNQAPSAIGKTLESAAEAVKRKLSGAPGDPTKGATQSDSLTIPEKKPEGAQVPHYSGAGKRDPFQALALKPQTRRRQRENLSPLERYELGQLKLVGIVLDAKQPRAMVEDSAGLGYVVGIGTAIGPDEGKIREIKPNEVVIEENYIDFYGARKTRRVNMKLLTE